MKSTILWVLAAVNLLLLAGLIAPLMNGNTAMAQRARRPEILMVPGEVVGEAAMVIYLVDSNNRQLGAVALNAKQNGLVGLRPADLNRAFTDEAAPRPGDR